ncbi:hypothetical protein KQX54_005018 [Cotesia glomerata]|uniref:Uncharacterized protein n=1 Tax=Cotesia glomerata TaxID=32391 RepID=A0AAV7IJ30_COTGL|nr:hypothetical protein KQX54_005018 [Cotesia glomerata]
MVVLEGISVAHADEYALDGRKCACIHSHLHIRVMAGINTAQQRTTTWMQREKRRECWDVDRIMISMSHEEAKEKRDEEARVIQGKHTPGILPE